MDNQEDKIESNGRGAPVGNKNAAKGAQLTAMLDFALNKDDKKLLRDGINQLAKAFSEGERWAIEFAFDRIEGKAVARTELSGADGSPLPLSIGISFVEPERTISEEA